MPASKTIALVFLAGFLGLLLGGRMRAQNPASGGNTTATARPLPKDVYPDSGNRLPLLKRDDLDDYGKSVYDELATLGGNPAPIRIYSPKLAKPMAEAHRYLKYDSGLGDRLTEIAVLTTVRALNSQVEWTEWEPQARPGKPSAVEPAIVDIIKYCKPVVGLGPKETLIINYGRELIGPGQKVSSATFAEAVRLFGRRGAVELTDLMVMYQATVTEMKAYDAHLHAGQKGLLPPPEATPDCYRS